VNNMTWEEIIKEKGYSEREEVIGDAKKNPARIALFRLEQHLNKLFLGQDTDINDMLFQIRKKIDEKKRVIEMAKKSDYGDEYLERLNFMIERLSNPVSSQNQKKYKPIVNFLEDLREIIRGKK